MPLVEYFRQWQQLNRNPENWQQREELHPGVLAACTWINEHASDVLDVGCGVARDKRNFTIPYYGIDITPKFVATAHQHETNVQRASATHLPYKTEAFDAVYCHNLLLHLPPTMWQQVLTEMIRVAKHWIVTVEPEWELQNNFQPRETLEENPILIFFSNSYSREEMIQFAYNQNVSYQYTCGYDVDRSRFLKKYVHWQVTIYTKK